MILQECQIYNIQIVLFSFLCCRKQLCLEQLGVQCQRRVTDEMALKATDGLIADLVLRRNPGT